MVHKIHENYDDNLYAMAHIKKDSGVNCLRWLFKCLMSQNLGNWHKLYYPNDHFKKLSLLKCNPGPTISHNLQVSKSTRHTSASAVFEMANNGAKAPHPIHGYLAASNCLAQALILSTLLYKIWFELRMLMKYTYTQDLMCFTVQPTKLLDRL